MYLRYIGANGRAVTGVSMLLVASIFLGIPVVQADDVPCIVFTSDEPYLVTETGELPENWPASFDVDVVSYAEYVICNPGSEAAGIAGEADDADGVAAQAAMLDNMVPPSTSETIGVTHPAIQTSFAMVQLSVLTMPSAGNNAPHHGCHYSNTYEAANIISDYFYVTVDFVGCLGNAWKNDEGQGSNWANAHKYAHDHGLTTHGEDLVMAWVRSNSNNGDAEGGSGDIGGVAVGAEKCPGWCWDWPEENIAQHELSHLVKADDRGCNIKSIMSSCYGSYKHYYDRSNAQSVCNYLKTCTVA